MKYHFMVASHRRALLRVCALTTTALSLTTTTPEWSQSAAKPSILLPGDYHKSEIEKDVMGEWWAVCSRDNLFELTRTFVTVELIEDSCNPGQYEKNGRRVTVSNCTATKLLLRNLGNLKEGVLKAGNILHDRDKDDLATLSYGGNLMHIKEGKAGETGYNLELTYLARKQIIYSTEFSDEGQWSVQWVGDLDGDERPDLLIFASDKYSVSVLRLFLSGSAGPDNLVREVATFRTTAC